MPFYLLPGHRQLHFAAMKQVIDMCLDQDRIGADGIYWDEMEMISPQRTYDRWDGHFRGAGRRAPDRASLVIRNCSRSRPRWR